VSAIVTWALQYPWRQLGTAIAQHTAVREICSPRTAFLPLVVIVALSFVFFFPGGRAAQAGQSQNSWLAQDIGYVPTAYTITAGGADIGDPADQFRFVYQQVTGDIDLVARVSSIDGGDQWSKAGVMIRETLEDNARHAVALVTKGSGSHFLRRIDPAGLTMATAGGSDLPPGWVKLTRRGYQLSAFSSVDGVTWTAIGVDTVPMQDSVYVGLAVTAHTGVATAVFDNFSMQLPDMGNQPPSVVLTSPSDGATYTGPADLVIAASAADSEGRLTTVEFFNGASTIGIATSAPYSITWSSVPAGTYTLTAIASDADGGTTTSAPVTVTIAVNQPPSATLTAPATGATYTAPATIALTASASDPENRLTSVEFYSGTALIGTAATGPYAMTWSSVPSGTYALRAIAYDADGASASSSTVTITVTANQPPAAALTAPADGATYTAPATIMLNANASDPENRLSRVEFYSGSTLLASDASAPFSFTWSSVPAGTYVLNAIAYDADGANAASSTVTVASPQIR
jgi:hypothetical protein